jgi:hypothetical protein
VDLNHDFRVQSAAPCHWTKREFRIVKERAAGERFERPYPDSKSRVLPLDDPASHLPFLHAWLRRCANLVAHDGIDPSFPVRKTGGLPLAECATKTKSPRLLSEALKNCAQLIAPVTLTILPPHLAAWWRLASGSNRNGVRASLLNSQLVLCHRSRTRSTAKSGGDAENRTLISRFEAVCPDPLDHIPDLGRRCRTRTGIQSLEGSVLILLNEAPLFYTWCGMQDLNLLRLA